MPFGTTQQFLPFKEIKEGAIILKNNALRGVLMVSSINFNLKSYPEQQAIIFQFQNFLNSLDFSCQILVRSRRMNITGYFENLKELENKEQNEILKTQIAEYRKFVEGLIKTGTIMRKEFYIIVPFAQTELKSLAGLLKGETSEKTFNQLKEQLWQRMEFIAIGLRRCGLTAIPLTTFEIVELLWSWYHPKEAEVGYYPEILPELIT